MNPDQIRAEAIDRIARAEWAEHHRAEAAMDNRAWETERPAFQDTYRRWAGRMVDALGDLLPTGIEHKPDPTDWPVQYRPPWRRYVTNWSPDA